MLERCWLRCCRFVPAVAVLPAEFLLTSAIAVLRKLLLRCGRSRPHRCHRPIIVVDSQTGYVLSEQEPMRNARSRSLTKIATAGVVLDWAEKQRRRSEPDRHDSAARPLSGWTKNELAFSLATRSSCAICFMPRWSSRTTSPPTPWPIMSVETLQSIAAGSARIEEARAGRHFRCANERAGQTTQDGTDAFRESQRHR